MKETDKNKMPERIYAPALKAQALLMISLLELSSLLGCDNHKNTGGEQKPSGAHILYTGWIKDDQDKSGKNKQGKVILFTEEGKEGNNVIKAKGLTLVFDARTERYIDFDGSNIIGDHREDSFSITVTKKAGWLTYRESSTYFYSPQGVMIETVGTEKGESLRRKRYLYKATDLDATSQMMVGEGVKKLQEATQRFKKYNQEIESQMKAGLK